LPVHVRVAGELIPAYRLPNAVMTSVESNLADQYGAIYRLPDSCWKNAGKNSKKTSNDRRRKEMVLH